MVEGANVGENGSFIRSRYVNVFGIKQWLNRQMMLGNFKGKIQIIKVIGRIKLGKVNQVGALTVNERIEGHAVLPRLRKVSDAYIWVAVCLPLTPEKQCLLGAVHLSICFIFKFNFNVLYLEAQYNRPEKPQNERLIAVDNVLGADTFQFNLQKKECKNRVNTRVPVASWDPKSGYLCMEKGETLVDILNFMDTHLAIIRLAQLFTANYFQKFEKLLSVGKVDKYVLNLHLCLVGFKKGACQ